MNDAARNISALFDPAGVVVAGASSHPGKFGFVTLHNILTSGYEGSVWATNLGAEEILGIQTVSSLKELPNNAAELLVICTPASTVVGLMRDGAARGIRAVFIASGGFGETGEEGMAAEREVVAVAEELGLAVAGPNGQGVVSTPSKLCAQIVAPNAQPGTISIVSQSGNLMSTFLNLSNQWGVGVARAISAGNAACLGVVDYLEWFGDDEPTSVALTYIEGLEDGADFLSRTREVTARKPVVVLKGGVSASGAQAAASHTGSLATNDRVFDGMVRQAGAVRARTVNDAFAFAAGFATLPLPDGPRTVVVTTVGGWGVLTSDALADSRLNQIDLPADLHDAIDALLPPRWSRNNPIDMAGGETRDTIPAVLRLVAAHPDVDAVIFLGAGIQANTAAMMKAGSFHPNHGLERMAEFHETQDARYVTAAMEISEETGTPILVASELATADPANPAPATLRAAGWPCFGSADQAVRVLDAMWSHVRFQQARLGSHTGDGGSPST